MKDGKTTSQVAACGVFCDSKKKRPPWWVGCILVMVLLLFSGCLRIPKENWIVSHRDTIETVKQVAECPNDCLNRDSLFPDDVSHDKSDRKNRHQELSADSFTMVSWNIYKGKKEGWAEDFEKITRNTDILVLQEVYLTDNLKELLQHAGYKWDMSKAFEYNDVSSGVLIAARTTPNFTCMFRETEPIIRIPKSVLVSRYPMSGTDRELLVANIHGINFTINQTAFQKQIDRMESILADHRGPMIVSGDFNTWSSGRNAYVNAMVKRLGLTAVKFGENHRSRFFGYDIDHVYYRGLKPGSATIPVVSTSDHNPLFVTFKLDPSQDEKN